MSDGVLSVSFKSSSWFLTQSLPVEVRDAHNRLIERFTGTRELRVPAGLYIVEATLPGGDRQTEVVAVEPDGRTDVELRAARGQDPTDGTGLAAAPGQGALESLTGGVATLPDVGPTRGGAEERPASVPVLIAHRACELREETGTSWVFDPVDDPPETPQASFSFDGRTMSTSLPVNPGGKVEERACTVTFAKRAGRLRADVGFARQRRVAWTLEGLVKSDDSVSTAELFRNADEILYAKYQDPAAAALGGLTLHRIGRLRERKDWVENLARDFAWVVDGRVLLAALLSNAEGASERARGLDTLLAVAAKRPLFGDGLALMIQLLRRWPDGAKEDERRDALAAITSNPLTVDWDAMALTMYDDD
jgi:hypothetical protein